MGLKPDLVRPVGRKRANPLASITSAARSLVHIATGSAKTISLLDLDLSSACTAGRQKQAAQLQLIVVLSAIGCK